MSLRSPTFLLAMGLFGVAAALVNTDAAPPTAPPVEFNRDIRPILSDHCFTCHGPDKAKRKADLRLDIQEGAFAASGDDKVIDPGKPEKSELLRRLVHADPKKRMPPASASRKLDDQQIALVRRWIEQGAVWQPHWAFITPKKPPLPEVKNKAWARNGIDHFILARLEKEGLAPSPEADKTTLIRRVSLDLTGLPPTTAEVDAFLADSSTDAYEKVVDRLLASPRYGERMASRWLDAARYADTNGYQSDGERTMWPWRNWVINAFNANQPFDQFTIEQIAGDLLPGATLEQKIATGFNRNHRGNAEGGIIPEEYAVEYVADRVETTATVWLGLTTTCCRCHDHKYDPLKQKEFYQLFAYFNNVPEHGKAIKYGNSPPYIKAPTDEQRRQWQDLEKKLTAAEDAFARLQPDTAWEKALDLKAPIHWSISDGLSASFLASQGRRPPEGPKPIGDVTIAADGRFGQIAEFSGKGLLDAGNVGDFGFYDKFTLAAWVRPAGDGVILSRTPDVAQAEGYQVRVEKGKVQVNLVKRWLDDALRVETERGLPANAWHHVQVSYDGTRLASGVKIYVNGKEEKLKVLLDDLNQSFKSKEPFRIGGGAESRFRGAVADVRIYDRALAADEAAMLANTDTITAIAALPAEKRSRDHILKLRAYFLDQVAPVAVRNAYRELVQLRRERDRLVESFPTTMVMEEMPTPRDSFILLRGEYDKRGEKVTPGVPAILPPLPKGISNNRLGFAKWLVDPTNPLTARVTVNRWWQMYFGTGLVKTTEDFGVQGEWPSHPELLDWLATELFLPTPSGRGVGGEGKAWDVKAFQKLIVTSATYRQSSKVTKELLQKDPENRLLAHGPRTRLAAEAVRDQALFISRLLVEKVGGPSVRPYQPAGLWKDLVESAAGDYVADRGQSLYRRSIYTFWKRTVAPPNMMTFDAAGREICVVRESRTNTPLQALNLMNDVTYVEASRKLAERVMTEQTTPAARLTLAFRLATARKPTEMELKILTAALEAHLARYRKDPPAALKLVSAGESKRNEKLDVAELAGYAAVCGMVLNLDKVITKE